MKIKDKTYEKRDLVEKYISKNVFFVSANSGIGAIPDAVLAQLGNHKNLGIHSEMFSDGVVDLCEKGAVTNTEKSIMTGKIVSSFAVGTKRLYDFMNNNPFVGELYLFTPFILFHTCFWHS